VVLLTSYDDHVYFTRGRSVGDCLSHAALRLRGEVFGKSEREGDVVRASPEVCNVSGDRVSVVEVCAQVDTKRTCTGLQSCRKKSEAPPDSTDSTFLRGPSAAGLSGSELWVGLNHEVYSTCANCRCDY